MKMEFWYIILLGSRENNWSKEARDKVKISNEVGTNVEQIVFVEK